MTTVSPYSTGSVCMWEGAVEGAEASDDRLPWLTPSQLSYQWILSFNPRKLFWVVTYHSDLICLEVCDSFSSYCICYLARSHINMYQDLCSFNRPLKQLLKSILINQKLDHQQIQKCFCALVQTIYKMIQSCSFTGTRWLTCLHLEKSTFISILFSVYKLFTKSIFKYQRGHLYLRFYLFYFQWGREGEKH